MPNDEMPGVYIEERPMRPARIEPWGPTLPAFVGYTERATGDSGEDLRLTPQRVDSMAEFERHFGGPPLETGLVAEVTETAAGPSVNLRWDEATRSRHILHQSMQLFFANGGSVAVVVSVGGFTPTGSGPAAADLVAGVDALHVVDDVTLIVIPEAQSMGWLWYGTVYRAALGQCAEFKDRFVIMDLPDALDDADADVGVAGANFRAVDLGSHPMFGAVYGPNLVTTLRRTIDESAIRVVRRVDGVAEAGVTLDRVSSGLRAQVRAAVLGLPVTLPPSGAVAAVYAQVDHSRGVWKAPANVPLVGVARPTVHIQAAQVDALNVDPVAGRSVNAIRELPGRGTVVWGARTLAGNDNEWRYVNVRRFVGHVEGAVRQGLRQFVFEPNDAATWGSVRGMIEDFLTALWRQGALQGAKPEEAFFVAAGLGVTMTDEDLLAGRLIAEVGLAVLRPAEFILLRFGQSQQTP